MVLFFSTRTPPPRFPDAWFDTLQFTARESLAWLFMAPLIILLDQKLPIFRKSFLQRILFHIPLCLLASTLTTYASEFVLSVLNGEIRIFSLSLDVLTRSWEGRFQVHHVLMYWFIIGAYMLYEYNNLLKERAIQTAKLEQSLSDARLKALKSQMHPHFLFNALNTISFHVEYDPQAACRLLEQLGELLRFSLNHSEKQEIPLAEEMTFINRYLALQKARFEEQLEVAINVEPETLSAMVPTFILEPFVENAIRHGIAPRSQEGVVEIRTQKENDRLRLSIIDDGPGLPQDWNEKKNAGIGIRNTYERLRCLYGDKNFALNITNTKEGGVRVELLLPFHTFGYNFQGNLNHA